MTYVYYQPRVGVKIAWGAQTRHRPQKRPSGLQIEIYTVSPPRGILKQTGEKVEGHDLRSNFAIDKPMSAVPYSHSEQEFEISFKKTDEILNLHYYFNKGAFKNYVDKEGGGGCEMSTLLNKS